MALGVSLAQNFNQKLANLNDKWNDFSFLLLKGAGVGVGGGGGGGSGGSGAGPSSAGRSSNARHDSYHSIESAVTCTAADFEAGNFQHHRESESESNQEFRSTRDAGQPGPSYGGRSVAGPSRSHEQRSRRPRLRTSRRNSASGDPKEFDMLVLKPIDTGEDDNESF
ncbi:heterogeneous nuclear ribonucleoproteins A1 homolog [Anopheles nili]|uniref:heterogeneous nuclear ribonucleoproteins A1 homolog n=1 Tax=Anopheles nili TaxID=185578 RepID=UPI00237B09D9|nr:heterogeneous nuclear ribonucleoproteins A1 homolog [Anopheles nili]